tara:strand:- start:1714 stop:2898 length:1185 start_codon:yes stop_codon:yes gene_type:complete
MAQSMSDITGVYATAIAAGIKSKGLDLGLLYVPDAVASAAVFTQHKFKASSVSYTQKCSKRYTLKAMIINSGNANAVTGKQGNIDTKAMATQTATLLGINPNEVGVASTGIIGKPLPMQVIQKGITTLCNQKEKKEGSRLAKAILTTDLVTKPTFKQAKIGKKVIQIAGITKGSGMIAPNMATTLGFLVTNAKMSQETLQHCLTKAIDKSYNMLSVDTDTSTNDMVVCFASGEYAINQYDPAQINAFQNLLDEACIDLAMQIAKDGEGATKLIEVQVINAARYQDAREIAKQVCDSPLVKTAIHGEDPNWGRLIMAIGKNHTLKINPDKIKLKLGSEIIVKEGQPVNIDRKRLKTHLQADKVIITVDCMIGKATATAWGCDLTKGYIDINTDYN